uniref:Uncharacterized protein n=1 Tax=Panagrolaimus davidi TaxID=227884 RepID=A0A914QDK2_9BILA
MRILSICHVDAKYYKSRNPPDLTQCASKLWMGTNIAFKMFLAANYGVETFSHDANRLLNRCVTRAGGPLCGRLILAYGYAEHFYMFTHQHFCFNPFEEFDERMEDVIFYINNIHRVDNTEVRKLIQQRYPQILDINGKKSPDLRVTEYDREIKKKLGGVEFTFTKALMKPFQKESLYPPQMKILDTN